MNFKSAHLPKDIAWAGLKSKTTASWLGLLLRVWVIIRLPLLLTALYFFAPDDFIWLVTISAIHLIGTLPERGAFFGLIVLILSGSFILSKKIASKPLRYLMPLGISFILFLSLFQLVPGPDPLVISLWLTGVLAFNTISETRLINFMTKNPGRWLADVIFAIIVGFSELLLLKPLLLWLSTRWQMGGRTSKVSKTLDVSQRWLPALILVPCLAVLSLDPYSLSDFHRTLFPDPAVDLFARGNFNWMELDLGRRVLYASGYGFNHLQAYNLDTLEQPPLISPVENGYAQGFAYNRAAQEMYIYNVLTQRLLVLDAITLELKRSMPIPELSPGDVWVAWDQFSDSLIISSEADEQKGVPTVIVDQTTGEILDGLNLDPGTIALHPNKPWLYLSFPRRIKELLVYDVLLHQIVQRAPASERLDRMAFVSQEDGLELLVSSPMDSAVLRFDAETLERKGSIKTGFGVRAIAVDPERQLLLCGSLVTNMLEVIDLTTGQHVAAYYLGPWLRTIVLDSEAGLAYVSSHRSLFTIRYAD